jgi:transcription elongation factor GreA
MSKIPMTVEGAARLRAELHRLKTIERPAVIQALADARSHGDLSENADYDAAKERQGFIEGRISHVETTLAQAQVIDPKQLDADGRVVFGATVEIEDADSGERMAYQIVGDDEADIKASKISVSSPIARALIGKSEGDAAEVSAPGGMHLRDHRSSLRVAARAARPAGPEQTRVAAGGRHATLNSVRKCKESEGASGEARGARANASRRRRPTRDAQLGAKVQGGRGRERRGPTGAGSRRATAATGRRRLRSRRGRLRVGATT